jgi:hypothetical protein
MFIQAIVLAVVIGLVLGGSLRNLSKMNIEDVYFIVAAFLVDAATIWSIRLGLVGIGPVTFTIDLFMYFLLFIFVYRNRQNPYIVVVGIGFLLNAVAIFSNGGAMPVGAYALQAAGMTLDVSTQGLYVAVVGSTRFWYLGDVIPYTFLNVNIISIGDLVSALGVMLLIITSMKTKKGGDNMITSFYGSGLNR